MGYGYFDVVAFEVYYGVEWFVGKVFFKQVEQAVSRYESFAVVVYYQAGVQEGVVLEHGHDEFVAKAVVAEYGGVGCEVYFGAVGGVGGCEF